MDGRCRESMQELFARARAAAAKTGRLATDIRNSAIEVRRAVSRSRSELEAVRHELVKCRNKCPLPILEKATGSGTNCPDAKDCLAADRHLAVQHAMRLPKRGE